MLEFVRVIPLEKSLPRFERRGRKEIREREMGILEEEEEDEIQERCSLRRAVRSFPFELYRLRPPFFIFNKSFL